MSKLPRVAIAAGLLLLCLVIVAGTANSQPPAKEVPPKPAPPAGKPTSARSAVPLCHFKQFMSWKKGKHAKAFEDLPAKYQGNADCLVCHVTGSGVASGYAGGTPDDILENLRAVTARPATVRAASTRKSPRSTPTCPSSTPPKRRKFATRFGGISRTTCASAATRPRATAPITRPTTSSSTWQSPCSRPRGARPAAGGLV